MKKGCLLLKCISIVIVFCCLCTQSRAQCTSTGTNSPESMSQNTSIGTITWSNQNGGLVSDNSRAAASALIIGNISHYLVATDFNFSLPTTALICGITVQVEKSASGFLQNVTDYSVRIVKGGVITGTNHALGGAWPTSDNYFTYGGAADTWGTTWSYSEINAADFGVAISARLNGLALLPSARIDHIRITVDYIDVLPIELLSCSANLLGESLVQIQWETSSESQNDFFTLEFSTDAQNWEHVENIEGAGNSIVLQSYQYHDILRSAGQAYYRLSQTDFNGNQEFLAVMSVDLTVDEMRLFPNPSAQHSILYLPVNISRVQIFNEVGKLVQERDLSCTDQILQYVISDLPVGLYFVNVLDCNGNSHVTKYVQLSE